MSGEYDEKFDALTKLVVRAVDGVDELRMEMRDMRKDITELRSDVSRIDTKLDQTNAQMLDIARLGFKNEDRIDKVEGRVEILEGGVH